MPVNPARLIVCAIVSLALAVLLVLQATSSVLMRKQPELSAQLMPINGQSLEQLAILRFQLGVTDVEDIIPSAKRGVPLAISAFGFDPLSPKSFSILALAEDDVATKRAILNQASAINRRDLMLQSLLLEDQVARQNYSETLDTLDNILRVHPEQASTFFPILIEALKSEEAATAMGGILDSDSQWHARFLESAARDRDALPNLARLRLQRAKVDQGIDQRLVRGLAVGGRLELAYQVYARANPDGVQQGGLAVGRLAWENDYPPFDWLLADEGGFRADYITEEDRLEVYLRSGKGGVLAERLVEAPIRSFAVGIGHTLEPAEQVKDIRLQVSCPNAEGPLIDEPFSVRQSEVIVPAMAGRCKFLNIAIYGRSWSGKSAIRGQIAPLTIREN